MSADALFQLIDEFAKKGRISKDEMNLLKAKAKELYLNDDELEVLIQERFQFIKDQKEKFEERTQFFKEGKERIENEKRKKADDEARKKEGFEKLRLQNIEQEKIKKEERKIFWKKYGGLVAIALILFIFFISGTVMYYIYYLQPQHGIYLITNHSKSENRIVDIKHEVGFVNKMGDKKIDAKTIKEFNEISILNRLFVFEINGKYGLVNEKGDIILTDIYSDIAVINDSVAKVKFNNLWVLVDFNGKTVSKAIYEDISNDLKLSNMLLIVREGKKGVIDNSGKLIIQPDYNQLKITDKNYFIAEKKGQWGVLQNNGKIKKEFIYDAIETCSNTTLVFFKKNNKYAVFNNNFVNIQPFKFDSYTCSNYDGLTKLEINGKYGLINENGKLVIPIQKDVIRFINKNSIVVNTVNGFINENDVFEQLKEIYIENNNIIKYKEYGFNERSSDEAFSYFIKGFLIDLISEKKFDSLIYCSSPILKEYTDNDIVIVRLTIPGLNTSCHTYIYDYYYDYNYISKLYPNINHFTLYFNKSPNYNCEDKATTPDGIYINQAEIENYNPDDSRCVKFFNDYNNYKQIKRVTIQYNKFHLKTLNFIFLKGSWYLLMIDDREC